MPRGAEQAERRPLPAAASRDGGGNKVVKRRPGVTAGPSRDGAAAQPRRVTRAGAARRGRRGWGVRGSGAHPCRIDIECDRRVARIAVDGVETGREPQTRPRGRLPRRRGGGCGWTCRSSDVRRRSHGLCERGRGPQRPPPPLATAHRGRRGHCPREAVAAASAGVGCVLSVGRG